MSVIETIRTALYGSPPSQAYQPSKEGVIESFDQLLQSVTVLTGGVIGSTATIRANVVALNAVSAANGTLGLVYNDPLVENNGIYHRTGDAWVFTGLLGTGPQGPGPTSETITAATADAVDAANRADVSAASAALSDAHAESLSGPTYPTIAAGLAASTSGEFFAVDGGDGTVSIYLNNAGVQVLQRSLATTGALASSGGSALVGTSTGTFKTLIETTPLPVEDFYEPADGLDWSPAFTRAAADPLALTRGVIAPSNAALRLLTSIDVWPNFAGQTPEFNLNGSTLIFGAAVPIAAHEAAGFRFRGLKSGAMANPINPRVVNGTFDLQNIAIANGSRAIHMENGSGWHYENLKFINTKFGFCISNFRYIDGGAIGTALGVVKNCTADGFILPTSGDLPWYAYSDSGDLTLKVPGDSVAAGETTLIPIPNSAVGSVNTPPSATPHLWQNATGAPIVVPVTLTIAALTTAGLTDLGTTGTILGEVVGAAVYMYYTSGGTKIPFCRHQGLANLVSDFEVNGGYYCFYTQGVDGPRFTRCTARNCIRGFANEWTARGLWFDSCNVIDPFSSAYLLGYGASGWNINNCSAQAMSARWQGEALFNIQLNSGGGRGRGNWTNTRNNVTTGQYHLNIGVNSGDIDFECDLKGDCALAYIAIQSAYVQGVGGPPAEAYGGGVQGGASMDMKNITISGSITPVTTKPINTGATMIALIQENDGVNGEIGLSDINLINIRANSVKASAKYLAIYEGSTAAKQVNNVTLQNVSFPIETNSSTAATRMPLPRKWGHFKLVKNVTNLDDDIERNVPDVATPDLTYGKYFRDTSVIALSGILGGQGGAAGEGYEGREIIIRGNNSRAFTTIAGVTTTRDGLRITGSPVTPTNVQRLRLTYSKDIIAWIGGLV